SRTCVRRTRSTLPHLPAKTRIFRRFDVGSLRLWTRSTAVVVAVTCAACHREPRTTTPRTMPTPTVQVGACGEPGRDGVMGASPRVDRADRDLNGDGVAESIVVDRALCTAEGNCY